MQPYATPIAQSLIGKLKGSPGSPPVRARVAARMLEALGELVQMGAEQMTDHLAALLWLRPLHGAAE